MRCLRHLELFVARERTEFGRNFHSNVLGTFEVCLELSSDSKDQFSFVADEFCELVHINDIAMCARLFVT